MHVLIHFTYIFNITIALTYIHYLIDDLSNMHTLKHFMYIHFFTCMILTQLIAEIQRSITKQGVFPFVIVWVWQWGAWKHAPM